MLMRSLVFLALALPSYNPAWANQCDEEKLLAKINYKNIMGQLLSTDVAYQVGESVSYDRLSYVADRFFLAASNFKSAFNSQLSPDELELFELNFRRALGHPRIKFALNNIKGIVKINLQEGNIWYCHANAEQTVTPKRNFAFCQFLSLPSLMPTYSGYSLDAFRHTVQIFEKGKYVTTYEGLNLDESMEAYIDRTTKAVCAQ